MDEYGDTCRLTYIPRHPRIPPLKFKTGSREQFYWRTVRDVRKTLPYAKLAFATLCETYSISRPSPTRRSVRNIWKRLEKDIFEQYKPVVKTMTKNQGKVLLKLINRETDQTSYSIVKAFFRQFPGRVLADIRPLFGMNMKGGLNPKKTRTMP